MREPLVGVWQTFLRGQELYEGPLDNDFGPMTHKATELYEQKIGAPIDGIVDEIVWGVALGDGIDLEQEVRRYQYPKTPDFSVLNQQQRHQNFGLIEAVASPVKGNPEAIRITNNWQKDYLTSIEIPQLAKLSKEKGSGRGFPSSGKIFWNKECIENVIGFFDYVERAGLLDRIESWAGSWVPRFIRGGGQTFSSHAWGTAFDINAPQNWMGNRPARLGQFGSILELVPLAHAWGFYWGGHFNMGPNLELGRRVDGMHFEVADKDRRPTMDPIWYTKEFSTRH